MRRKKYTDDEILELLKKYFIMDSFRDYQFEIIKAILSGKDTLSILGTGAGKSLCYQFPALLMAEKGQYTIIIEPIISLMIDQCNRINEYLANAKSSVKAIAINSQTSDYDIYQYKNNPEIYKIIFVSPESFTGAFADDFFQNNTVSMIVIDEAHCVSLWGHDFRPTYCMITNTIHKYCPKKPIIAAFTATATKPVVRDIIKLLDLKISPDNRDNNLFIGSMLRENLNLLSYRKKDDTKNEYIADYVLNHKDELGIIYCNTKKNVNELYKYLTDLKVNCAKYYGISNNEEGGDDSSSLRKRNSATLKKFFNDNSGLSCVIATSAFGMGIDKPTGRDVTYIIHYSLPRALENYYQEVGRAGRHTDNKTNCILLYNKKDIFLLNAWTKTNPDYISNSIEYKIAMDRINKMVDYANLKTPEERNKYIDYYFNSYEPPIEQTSSTNYIYLNRSLYGWFLIRTKNLKNPDMPDYFDVMIMDAINSLIMNGKTSFTYLDILRLLSGKDYFDSKSPLNLDVRDTIAGLANKGFSIKRNGNYEIKKMLFDNTFKKVAVKNGESLVYNHDAPSFYFDPQARYYKMPSNLLALPTKEQVSQFAENNEKLMPMPQTKEGLMIKYYLLSKITYCRHMKFTGVQRNWSINLSEMMISLNISFPASKKGEIAKKKRLLRYVEDYLKALKDYKYIYDYKFDTTKRVTGRTIFLYGSSVEQKYNRVNIIYAQTV